MSEQPVVINHTTVRPEGVKAAKVDAAREMRFRNNGNQILCVHNQAKDEVEITIHFAADRHGRTGSRKVKVEVGAEIYVGPFYPELHNQAGCVHLDFSACKGVGVGVVSLQS